MAKSTIPFPENKTRKTLRQIEAELGQLGQIVVHEAEFDRLCQIVHEADLRDWELSYSKRQVCGIDPLFLKDDEIISLLEQLRAELSKQAQCEYDINSLKYWMMSEVARTGELYNRLLLWGSVPHAKEYQPWRDKMEKKRVRAIRRQEKLLRQGVTVLKPIVEKPQC